MRRFGLLGGLHAAALLMAVAGAPPAYADPTEPGFAERVAPALPAVVTIQAMVQHQHGRLSFDGSGFIVDPSGLIVTNRHVIAGAFQINVTVPGDGRKAATALYVSERLDLAILKVDVGHKLPVLTLGDSAGVRVGDEVLLLGNPLAVGESLSHGVISALNRDIGETQYDHFFQTDAPINHGSSGGPMLNMAGQVIGINTALDSSPGNTGSVGVGFTLPINDAKVIIEEFLHNGHVTAGTMGVQAQRVSEDLAEAMGMEAPRGLLVTEVDPKGPAAGLIRIGDIVLALNGRDASDAREMARWVATQPAGQPLEVKLRRDGAEQTVSVMVREVQTDPKLGLAILGHAPPWASTFAKPADTGMRLESIGPLARKRFSLGPKVTGVVVAEVAPTSAAARRKIVAGDVIVAIGAAPVLQPHDVEVLLRALDARKIPFAALLVEGSRGRHWVALPLEADR